MNQNTKYTSRKTQEGNWWVFESTQTMPAAGPFKTINESHQWIDKKQIVTEAAKWRSNPDAYDVDDEGNKTPKTANKFSYDPLTHRQDTAGDSKTARGKKWALKTSIKMAKGQHGPKGILPEQGVAEGSSYNIDQDDIDEFSPSEIERIKNAHFPDTLRQNLRDAKKEEALRARFEKLRTDNSGSESHLGSPTGSSSSNTYENAKNSAEKINELSPQTLASYKKKAGAAASEADKRGEFEKGHKRFKGIMKATKKEFEQDRKNVRENAESTADKKTEAKIAALEKKIKDAQDALGLARERRKMKGQRQQGPREISLGSKLDDLRQQMHTLKVSKKTAVNEDREYYAAERALADAKIAKENGDMGDYYTLMAEYHDNMMQWNQSKGRYNAADRDAEKVKQYTDAAQKHNLYSNVNEDREYYAAERTLADAKIAKENGDMGDYYTLMAEYHDNMMQWNQSKGRYDAADRDAKKVEQYNDAAQKHNLYSNVNEDGLIGNPSDKVTMDVPLMIRIMEYAREDAQTDMDLHNVAEQLIKLSASGKTLSMQDYESIVGQQNENKIFELGAIGSAIGSVARAQTTTKPTSPTTTQANTQPAGATSTTSPTTTKPTTSPTTTAAKPGATNLKPDEQEALNKIMTNAGLKTQFQQLVQKSKTVPGV